MDEIKKVYLVLDRYRSAPMCDRTGRYFQVATFISEDNANQYAQKKAGYFVVCRAASKADLSLARDK